MTATLRPATEAPPPAEAKKPRSYRWLRLVVPYLVVLALLGISGLAYSLDSPDPEDATFLSPLRNDDVGASKLAGRLRERGITVERVTDAGAALTSAHRGDATLFVPAPEFVHSYHLRMLKLMPSTTNVVLVRPDARTLDRGYLPVGVEEEHWATRVGQPGCDDPAARTAGRAAADRIRYLTDIDLALVSCYAGGLVRTRHVATTVTAIGAAEPFRNDRIDEYGNAALAVGLLSGARRVIWLDVHKAQPGPRFLEGTDLDPSPAPADLGRVGSPDPDFPVPDDEGTEGGNPQPGVRRGGGGGNSGQSTADLFPASAWSVLALALLAFVLAALAAGRRIGAPVHEPLPVLVPSTETVTGRGRLYERSRDRTAAAAVLSQAARTRLAHLLDQPPEVDRATLVAAVAAQAGAPKETVAELLYGERWLDDDDALVAFAAALDSLIDAVIAVPADKENP
ncbi:hypothetical protein Val02_79370 [Virgisporangium aliadipatigenens]|uniref:DUF4350 domain-containing protein n=1 Tax=Virgisporangium aliadipatigenens TaxID=741659 RepID=A0A8J3YWH2_9ACTN|nr:DUF4350 domain-containing protein [Virgisporangium aliadipatigenens]GIJ51051.1 hypothetical protein Val02_79370 [Virgisporangium aliadipatigenens]